MIDRDEEDRDLASLTVARVGALTDTGEVWEPWRLLDSAGEVVGPVAAWLRDLQAARRSALIQRQMGWICCAGTDSCGDRGALEPCNPGRGARLLPLDPDHRQATNSWSGCRCSKPVTGKLRPGAKYAASTRSHSETALRGFYEFHREVGTGPMINPFPLARRNARAHAHHNPMEPYRNERSGLYRPRQVQRVPHSIPDEKFNELFARLPSHRDRALVALWVSSGAGAAELLGGRHRATPTPASS